MTSFEEVQLPSISLHRGFQPPSHCPVLLEPSRSDDAIGGDPLKFRTTGDTCKFMAFLHGIDITALSALATLLINCPYPPYLIFTPPPIPFPSQKTASIPAYGAINRSPPAHGTTSSSSYTKNHSVVLFAQRPMSCLSVARSLPKRPPQSSISDRESTSRRTDWYSVCATTHPAARVRYHTYICHVR